MRKITFIADGLLIFIIIYRYILLARIILSLFQAGFYRSQFMVSIYRLVFGLTEPLLAPIRRVVPIIRAGMSYLDLSPLVLLILLSVLEGIIHKYL